MQPERRVDHDRAAHALGMVRGDVDGKVRAEGVPAQDHPLEPERVQHREHVAGVVRHAVAGGRTAAPPAPSEVGRDDAELGTEPRRDEAAKLVCVGREPVQQHQGRLAPGQVEHVQAYFAHVDEARSVGGRHACCPAYCSRSTRLSVLPAVLRGKSSESMHVVDLLVSRGDARVDPGLELFRADHAGLLQHDGGHRRLAPLLVRHAEHRDFAHRWMLHGDLLDVLRVDVHAAGDDEVLLPIDEMQKAVLVGKADVAGDAASRPRSPAR